MKNISKLLVLLLVISMLVCSLVSCEQLSSLFGNDDKNGTDENENNNSNGDESGSGGEALAPWVDYVSEITFDPNSGRAYTEASVKIFVDGDTTHFGVSKDVCSTGVLKARYLAINTPESTGQIEPWGKKASNYTKSALKEATSIIIESDTASWNLDSTGDRYLVWVWYKTAESDTYRNLNLEILQAGLAVASNSSKNSYGETAVKILAQAMAYKLYVHSKEKDPDFYYGSAIPLTLKELKLNIEEYADKSVSFEAVVVKVADQTAYLEEYDEETGVYFGIQVYYGWSLNYFGEQIISTVGNRVQIVGTVQYYETGGTYQVSDLYYSAMNPDHPDNIKLISGGNAASYEEIGVEALLDGALEFEVTKTDDDGAETVSTTILDRGFVSMHSSATVKNLTVLEVYTTKEGSSAGAMSITCEDEDGNEIVLRTGVLLDSNGSTVTYESFPVGSVLDAKGVIDVYNGDYQLKVFSLDDVTFHSDAE